VIATPMLDKVRKYAKRWGIRIASDLGDTHDGPGLFGIHWPSRTVVEPFATFPKRERVATDSDTWYLIHEISHILVNVDPDDVDEVHSSMIAMDYYAGQHLGLSGWDDWMEDFTLPAMEMVARDPGDQEVSLLRSCEWSDVDKTVQARLLERSLGDAIAKGLLTEDGTPTFNCAAWMPVSMLVERAATRLLTAAIVEASR